MLVYHVMDDETILWMISKPHFSSATIDAGRDELNQKIDNFRKHALRLAQRDQRGSVILVPPRPRHQRRRVSHHVGCVRPSIPPQNPVIFSVPGVPPFDAAFFFQFRQR
jgi:hypothetical protein